MREYILSAFADEASQSIAGQIKAMRENEVSALEIRSVEGKNVSALDKSELERISAALSESGISVFSIGSPVGKSGITDDFSKEIERFKRVLYAAEVLNARCIRLFSFYGVDSEGKKDEALYRISEFVRVSSGYNVTLCHENEKGIFGDNEDNCLEIHRAFPSVKAVFDPANYIQCGRDTKVAWEKIAPYTEYIHVKDALSDGSIVPAGVGIGNLEFIADDFLSRGGRVFSLEPHLRVFETLSQLQSEELKFAYTYQSAEEAFKASADAFKAILQKL